MQAKHPTRLGWWLAAGLLLNGCGGSGGEALDEREVSGDDAPSGAVVAAFDPLNEVLPFPANLMFLGSSDGTVNVPNDDPSAADYPIKAALNSLDGFSTVAPWRTGFKGALDPASVVGGHSVRVFQLATDDALLPMPVGLERELEPGVDYAVSIAGADDELIISPLRPLAEASYFVAVLTRDLKGRRGESVHPSLFYAIAKGRTPHADPSSDAEQMRRLTDADLSVLEAAGVLDRSQVVLSWGVRTQTVTATLANLRAQVQPTQITLFNVGSAPGRSSPETPGKAAYIWPGTIELPYYLRHRAGGSPQQPVHEPRVLSEHWRCNGGECAAPANRDAAPEERFRQTVPLVAAVPKGRAPSGGWPLVIFAHTIQQNRTTALGIADALAARGFAVMAIDLPLHGLVLNQMDPDNDELDAQLVDLHAHNMSAATHVLGNRFLPAHAERTLYLDLLDADGRLTGPGGTDGEVDPSGAHFINPQNMLVFRDNLRQAVADLFTLTATLRAGSVEVTKVPWYLLGSSGAPTPSFNPEQIYFLGHGLGATVGVPFLALEEGVRDAALVMGSGGIARMLEGSEVVGPLLREGLIEAGQEPGSASWDQFFTILQAALDSADPQNYAARVVAEAGADGAAAYRSVHLLDIVGGADSPADLVTPVAVGGEPLSGSAALAATLGLRQAPDAAELAQAVEGYAAVEPDDYGRLRRRVSFAFGNHASLLLPDEEFVNPATGEAVATPGAGAAHVEMQRQLAEFFDQARHGHARIEVRSDLVRGAD